MPEAEDKIDAAAARLRTIVDSADYYALTLTADPEGRLVWSAQSAYAGTGSRPMWELRAPSLVRPEAMRRLWADVGQACLVVNDDLGLAVFLRAGGNALVERTVAQRRLASVLEPVEAVPGPVLSGVRLLSSVPSAGLRHAPTKKIRMDVLRRDDFRCRLCGRRAADHVDLELHVHHIRPHAKGGLTEPENLITLCHTCHAGLDPHFELRLFDLIPGGAPIGALDIDVAGEQHADRVRRYRDLVHRLQVRTQRGPSGTRGRQGAVLG